MATRSRSFDNFDAFYNCIVHVAARGQFVFIVEQRVNPRVPWSEEDHRRHGDTIVHLGLQLEGVAMALDLEGGLPASTG